MFIQNIGYCVWRSARIFNFRMRTGFRSGVYKLPGNAQEVEQPQINFLFYGWFKTNYCCVISNGIV